MGEVKDGELDGSPDAAQSFSAICGLYAEPVANLDLQILSPDLQPPKVCLLATRGNIFYRYSFYGMRRCGASNPKPRPRQLPKIQSREDSRTRRTWTRQRSFLVSYQVLVTRELTEKQAPAPGTNQHNWTNAKKHLTLTAHFSSTLA